LDRALDLIAAGAAAVGVGQREQERRLGQLPGAGEVLVGAIALARRLHAQGEAVIALEVERHARRIAAGAGLLPRAAHAHHALVEGGRRAIEADRLAERGVAAATRERGIEARRDQVLDGVGALRLR